MSVEPAFNGAGKEVGQELWRIEALKPVKLPGVTGKFHQGDSYIMLVTSETKSGALAWAIHFWLGSETTADESGIAAYKTVELDDSLGGGPVQYREVEGNESALFLSYFKHSGGIEYLPGGVDSGFRTVERDVYEPRLLHLKGKRTVRVAEVPLKLSSLCQGDVFILDAGLTLYVFNGPTANRNEKTKGAEVAQNLKDDDRGGRAEIVLIHEDPQNADFWGYFGGYTDPSTLPEGEDDESADKAAEKHGRKLFHISDESGELAFDEVAPAQGTNHYSKAQLVSDDVFLLHSMQNKIFLWIGRGANVNEKKEATARAVSYISTHGLPASTAIERVAEGTETASFKSEFTVWDAPRSFGFTAKTNTSSSDGASPVDVAALLARKAVEDTPVDDGSGELTIWRIKDFKKDPEALANYGQFHGGDSYILLYTYSKGRSEEHIIYFWLGNDSTADEKGAAALLTVELDDSMGGKPVQVRVTQGKEPAHFRQLFKGKMIVFRGGNESGFSNKNGAGADSGGAADIGTDEALFHIRGTTALNTVAVEVAPTATALNSEDSFVLVTPSTVFVWHGLAANDDEVTVATSTATTLAGSYNNTGGREVVSVAEGDEPEEFWAALGGKQQYPSLSPGEAPPKDPRLFAASTATGAFKVEEVDNFDQSDLNDEDVFLLDTYTQLFVWIGSQSTQQEKDQAMEFAQRYVTEADDGRDPDLPIIRIAAGDEPAMFSCHFHAWDAEYFSKRAFTDPYQAKLDALNAANAEKRNATSPAPSQLKKTNSVHLEAAINPPPAASFAAAEEPSLAPAAAPAKVYAAASPG
eukprot:CAMPEP_0181317536 /NCGR_PEP_ID=MMETSP1101-20121128/16522_1 /TAXON_ID=46948 /ORGANISM="Rhodomonas abbreviata, Strain Caron Lab Isolate" /LENGTH=809 /DNA_ID=CAMNT_0023424939 /DNA_START=45 /DNA_END=2470 /DNA_ORIENTATION=+